MYAVMMGLYNSPAMSVLKVCDRHAMNLESCLNHPVETDVNFLPFVLSLVQTALQIACFDFSVGQEEVPEGIIN